MDECAEMPTCSLAKTIHNRWPIIWKQYDLYDKVIVNDLIHAFKLIANLKLMVER